MQFERISVKALILWEIVAVILFSLLTLLAIFVLNPGTWLWYLVLWLIGALCVAVCFLYLPMLYLNIEYSIGRETIVYKNGVIFPSTQILYRDRVAFVTVYKNPLTPILHISSLVISAAGGSVRILFLNTKRAEEIADMLSK